MSDTLGRPMVNIDSKAIETRLHELIGPSIRINDICLDPTALHVVALWILCQQRALLFHFPWAH